MRRRRHETPGTWGAILLLAAAVALVVPSAAGAVTELDPAAVEPEGETAETPRADPERDEADRADPERAETEPGADDAEDRITVEVGTQTLVDAPGVVQVAVGDPAIADIQVVEGHEVLVTGVAHGRTTLHVWYRDRDVRYVVDVTDAGRSAEIEQAVELLGLQDVIRVHAVGRRIAIDGRVETVDAYERYLKLVESWPHLVDLVRIDPAVIQEIADRIATALEAAEIEGVEVRVVGGTLFLEGSVADEAERQRAERIARAIHGQVDRSRLD